MTPGEYCAAKAAPAGSGLYYALLYHRPAERRALHACFAFLEELRREPGPIADPAPAARRLLWWREELGPGRLELSRHPVVAELRALPLTPDAIPSALSGSIGAGLRELSGWRPETEAEWRSHCHVLNAGPWQLAARICSGTPDSGGMETIGTLAALHGQLEHVLEFALRTASGCCPLPGETLVRHGAKATPQSPPDAELLHAVAAATAGVRQGLFTAIPAHASQLRPIPTFCRVLRRIDLALCDRILRRPERLLTERISLTPLRKLWIAWHESIGHKP